MTTAPRWPAGLSDTVIDKTLTEEEVVDRLWDGMTLGIGGWGSRRKPMSVVRAILRSDLRDLTVVSCGGPDVGMLCAAGRVRKLVFAFVTLDVIPLEPYFRRAREAGELATREMDEGMLLLGLQAASWRLPFLPTRAGLGSDLFKLDPALRTVTSPYPGPSGPPEELVAVPAIPLDAAIVHVNRADRAGNGQLLDDDPFFDQLFLGAARHGYVTCEELVDTGDLMAQGGFRTLAFGRHLVDGVARAPGGSHPTSCGPERPRDPAFLSAYAASATEDGGWDRFRAEWVDGVPEAEYQLKVTR
jgi:glutaconate CoA-transferase subunit A